MIYLDTLQSINGFEIKKRYGRAFRKIRRIQPKDSISYLYTVYRGNIQLEEFRRLKSAQKFCLTA